MNITKDFHSHTQYSDGKGTIEDNVKAGVAKGLKAIAITEHGYGHLFYGCKKKNIPQMRKEIDRLQEKYPQIRILLGMEANIVGEDGSLDVTKEEEKDLDILLAGYHFGSKPKKLWRDGSLHLINLLHKYLGLFKKQAIRRNTRALVQAMRKNKFFILTHPGDKGPVDIVEVAKVAKEEGVLLEINRRHKHLNVEQLKLIRDIGNTFVISSDAHRPEDLAEVDDCIQRVIDAGIDFSRVINLEVPNEN